MAVSARSAKKPSPSVRSGLADMRTGARLLAGSFLYEGDELVTTWHHHDLHQIEYALRGSVEVETSAAHYLLPPQQAAWIPAGLEHRSTILRRVRTISVFFEPHMVPGGADRVRIVAVPAVVREMLIFAERWPIGASAPDPASEAFYLALAHLVAEALDHEAPLSLAVSSDPLVNAAMAWTRQHMATATIGKAARAVGLSERSLRRRFEADAGLTWSAYLLQARVLRAMTLLAEPGPSVLQVATEVGYESVSSFSRAFRQRTGESPGGYRRRRLGGPEAP